MDQQKKKLFSRLVVNAVLITGIFVSALAFSTGRGGATTQDSDDFAVVPKNWLSAETDPSTIFLPVVMKNYPKPLSIFGVEILKNSVLGTVDLAANANISWVRYNGILWHEVEPVSVDNSDNYDWSKLSTFEAEILSLRDQGITPMVIIRGTPEWARYDEYPDHICGPIRDDALDDFATFVADMVEKYSQSPYDIQYWELGNEPDVHPELFTVEQSAIYPFGCWGDVNDTFYGGGWYADMLKEVYPAIKQANPKAQVILGGLLLVCDLGEPGKETDCLAANYLEGILSNGGGDYVDIIAYHAYPYWYPNSGIIDWDLNQHLWDHRGGTLAGKLSFIQEIMDIYNVQKPILMNEGGLMCGYYIGHPDYTSCLTEEYEQDKANYVVRMYARTGAIGIQGSAWFTLNGPGWRNGGLLSGSNPRPAYNAYAFLSNKLDGAEYSRQLSAGTFEGYEYITKSGMRYQIYWSNTAETFSISKPANTLAVYDRYGTVLSMETNITIGFDPIIIEIVP